MKLLSEIQQAIFELEDLNSRKEDIRITTSFITKRIFEVVIGEYTYHSIPKLDVQGSKLFGVEVSFNHYSNDIVIYDETRACYDERFKITIQYR